MQTIFTVKSYIRLYEPRILGFNLLAGTFSPSASNKTIDFIAGLSSIFLKLSFEKPIYYLSVFP